MNSDDRPVDEPTGDEYPEHRSRKQLRVDRANVRRQLKVMDPAGADRLNGIVRSIQARQDRAPARYALPFDRYPVTDGAGRESYVLVARGQLVVRLEPTDQPPDPSQRGAPAAGSEAAQCEPEPDVDVSRALAELGYQPLKSTARPRDPRTAVFQGSKGWQELVHDVEWLSRSGIEAAAHLVVPLGHIIKGDDYPSATAGLGTFPPLGAAGGATDVRVAVIDTGITPESRADKWLGAIVREPENTDLLDVLPDDGNGNGDGRVDWGGGHGSFAAGIVQRVAPGCEVVAYRFTRSDGLGTEKDVAEAMLLAAEEGDRDGVRLIINASLGTPGVDGAEPPALRDAVQLIEDRYPDVLIVASAGNSGTTDRVYPAALGKVVAVGALTDDLQPAPFSNHGDWLTCSTIGVGVVSTFVAGTMPPEPDPAMPDFVFPANSWAVWTGTSFSAPQISGAVAKACQGDPALSPRDALDALLAGRDEIDGYGRIVELLPGTPV
jgi:thermitase